MINVLIVEDEPPIARTLGLYIEQMGGGHFHVAGKAINGQDALKMLPAVKADIIFTDIRMPVMDGLELMKELNDKYPDVLLIVLSGYQQFDYAQTALRYGAFDYLLKPISKDEVGKLLEKLRVICEDRSKSRKQEQLANAMHGKKLNGASMSDCTAMLICAGAIPLFTDDILLPGGSFWERHPIEDVIDGLFDSQKSFFYFNGNTVSEKYIIVENLQPKESQEIIRFIFEKLTELDEIYINMVSHRFPVSFERVGKTALKLRSYLCREALLCSSMLFWYSGNTDHNKRKTIIEPKLYQLIVDNIYMQKEEKLYDTLSQALECDKNITQAEFLQLMDLVVSNSRLSGIYDPAILSETKTGLNEAVSNSTSVSDLLREAVMILLPLGRSILHKGKQEANDVADQLEQYLIMNFNKPITSETMSKKFGFVPSYLSKIFRTAKGVSPSDFLTSYRVEKAKQILREQPDVKIRDVAKATGYDDQYYFSKIFKKQTGQWPSNFQESFRKSL